MPLFTANESVRQFIRFIIVGLLSTAVNYGFFYLLFAFAALHYQIASAIGFLAGVGTGFPLNRRWTYGHQGKTDVGLGLKYGAVYGLSLLSGLVLLSFQVNRLFIDPIWANIVVIGFTTCTNFIGTKLWVFRK